tara:strand:- start:62 stop:232 length:171 start_codon:yes stop_codon:yes gene_type:complete
MSGSINYIKHASGRQRQCSDEELEAYKAAGWQVERRVEVAKKPAKKKPAKKAKAKD